MTAEEKPKKKRTAKATAPGEKTQSPAKARAGAGKGSRAGADKETGRGTARPRRTAERAPEEAPQTSGARVRPLPRLLGRFRDEVTPQMVKEFGYKTPMQVPRLSKIVLNIGLAESLENSKALESATQDLTLITGQRPVTTRARKSIAAFKLREGMAIGLMVTLRGRRMYEFLDRLINSALPRIRDFRGLSREAFDGRGNYSIGIREQVIFPEIDYNTIERIRGLQAVIVTTAPNDREGFRLLEILGVPFARPETDSRAA